MISITNFYKDITQYFQLGKAIFIPTPYGCKHCGYLGRIHRHGYYQRNAITRYTVYRIHILRLKCPSCKKTFSVLPSFLIPYYQYTFEVIFLCLYYFYVLKFDYNKVISTLQSFHAQCAITTTYLCNFKQRMSQCTPLVRLFFAHYDDFYSDMDCIDASLAVLKIHQFIESKKDFNFEYFCRMPKYFFAKP
ncbi:MAG: hypothetical protein PWQ70_1238 [Clostridiales bacterium]|nr:hypothetical protein [Clostridiales bacterium]